MIVDKADKVEMSKKKNAAMKEIVPECFQLLAS